MLWAGDTRRKLLANVTAYGGSVALVAVTAPGVDGVPFWTRSEGSWVDVPGWRAHRIPWGAPGRADPREAARWNRTAPDRWRELHRAAAQAARRRHGRFSLVARTWEFQRRGLLHVHVVLGVATARELAAAHTYVAELEKLRDRYGFGFLDRGRKRHGGRRTLEVVPAERAARYVAKYLSPLTRDGKPSLSETVVRKDVPRSVAYVSTSLTLRTGVTIRWLRFVRYAWVLGISPNTGEVIRPRAQNAGEAHVVTGDSRGP